MADKLNIEEIKKNKDGLDVLPDLLRYAETGFDTIPPEDFALFRWYGLYQQRPNEGHFMLRIKVPNGHLTAEQLRVLGNIAIDFGRNLIDITTRQDFQYHWLTIDNIPEIFRRLQTVGMTTSGACGDITRNVVGCPVTGITKDEYFDSLPHAQAITAMMVNNKEFSNMPRKYKFSVCSCYQQCAQPEINEVGFYGVKKGDQLGYGLMVGGGLSTKPYFGADMNAFVKPEQVLAVGHAISEIYRDAEILRKNRGQARLKFYLHDAKIGIGAEAFRAMIQEKLDFTLEEGVPNPAPRDAESDHLGVHQQKQDGYYYLGLGIRAGRLTGEQLLKIADLIDEFSDTKVGRNTNKQNFIITHIPEAKLDALKAKVTEAGFDYEPSVFKRSLISCTGIEFCNLAVTETKEVGRRVSRQLEERFPGATRNIRIHFSGCPNNCGQNAIADIGLRGMKTKGPDGVMIEAYDILVGGGTGTDRAFAEVAVKKYPGHDIATAIGNLYEGYCNWAAPEQTFRDYVRAHSKEQLEAVAKNLPMPEAVPEEVAPQV
jgi:sulfite reductase beta subunit-like hemoprotein